MVSRTEIAIMHTRLVDERLKRDGISVVRESFRGRRVGDATIRDGTPARDTAGDFVRELLSVAGRLHVGSFGWVGQKSAFDEHGRNICSA